MNYDKDSVLNEKTDLDKLDPKNIKGTPEELEIIIDVFNGRLYQLLSICKEKNHDSVEFNVLQRLMKETQAADPLLMLLKCKDKMWDARDYIKKCDEKYFLERDYSNLIKPDGNKDFINMLIDLIKNGWKTLFQEEKDVIWGKTRTMFKAIVLHTKWSRVK